MDYKNNKFDDVEDILNFFGKGKNKQKQSEEKPTQFENFDEEQTKNKNYDVEIDDEEQTENKDYDVEIDDNEYVYVSPNEKVLDDEFEDDEPGDVKTELFEIIGTAVRSIIGVVLIFTFLFRIVGVEGPSMENTLHSKDYILMTDFFYKPKINDIVVVYMPEFSDGNPIIKRIIALENDEIYIDNSGNVYRNNEKLDEPYINPPTFTKNNQELNIKVPEGQIFVMGDNRMRSTDSRDESIGCIDEKLILGTAFFRLFPFDKIGEIK